MKRHERIVWILFIALVAAAALWDRTRSRSPDVAVETQPDDWSIDAKCGIATGGSLSSNNVAITCGLDESGIEAVIASAVSELDLEAIASQVRSSTATPAELDAMALRLGLTRETLIELLIQLQASQPERPVTPERLATAITNPQSPIIIEVTSTVTKAGRSNGATSTTSSRGASDQPSVDPIIFRESRSIQAECGIAVGVDINMADARITCGPSGEDIEQIVKRVVGKSNVDQLIGDLRRGVVAQTELFQGFEQELSLSRTTVLQLLKGLADEDPTPDQAPAMLTAAATQHVSLSYRLSQLPEYDSDAARLRRLVARAIEAGEFETAEALLMQWSRLQEANQELVASRQQLTDLKTQGQALAAAGDDQKTVIYPDSEEAAEEPTTDIGSKESEDGDPASDESAAFVREDRVELNTPQRVVAGTVMRFPWKGPAAPDDLIFIVESNVAENTYPHSDRRHHGAGKRSPAVLIAPATPGRFEIRYFSFSNGKPLVRVPLEVLPPEVSFDLPAEIVAGNEISFTWKGPNASGDLIFFAEPTMQDNRYILSSRKRHKTGDGSTATLVAPAQPGAAELRYFSFDNGTALFRHTVDVKPAAVAFTAPESVGPGAHLIIPWDGPDADGDLIFISKSGRPSNEYPILSRHRHATENGSVAELVAPAEPGTYEIRYFSFANGAVLHAQQLTVQ